MDALQPWHSQPVFVASTFQDMQAERDHLLTRVFPALEEWLAARHRHLEWVDLRTGVSAAGGETSRELQILSVCLDEVRRSRPFLIALIGDRYGWIPPHERAAAAVAEIGFDTGVAGRSVTDLEIDFGVLHDPEQGRRSIVFLRAPLPYDEMPPETAALYCENRSMHPEAGARTERLAQLKARLRQRVPERCFEYVASWDRAANRVTGLESWGRMVEVQLRNAFEREFRDDPVRETLPWDEAEAQTIENLIEDRTRGFVGRTTVLSRLQEIVTSSAAEENPWTVCVVGDPGAGKTALFGELWKRVREGKGLTLVHAVGASTHGTWIGFMLRRFTAELTVHPDATHWFRFTETGEIWNRQVLDAARAPDATDEQIYAAFGQMLSWAAEERRVVVLIDALDQFDEFTQAQFVSWAAGHWPANARLVVTTTPGAMAERLAEIDGVVCVPVPPLDEAEVRGIGNAICGRYHRRLPLPVMDALAARRRDLRSAVVLPLWVVLATEELNLLDADDFAHARRVYRGNDDERIASLMCERIANMPDDVQGLYTAGIARAEMLFDRMLTVAFLGPIAVSRFGLRESDFRVLIPALRGTEWDELQFAQLRRLFRGQLRRREPSGRWDFNHRQMRVAVRRWLSTHGVDERRLHDAIATHLLALSADDPVRTSDVLLHLIESENRARTAAYLAAFDGDETAHAALTAMVNELRSPSGRSREETAARLVLTLTASNVDAATLSQAAMRLVDVFYGVQGRCSLTAERIILEGVEDCLRGVIERHPGNPEFLRARARCLHFLGHLRKDAGDLDGALTAYREVQVLDRCIATHDESAGVTSPVRFRASVSIGDALLSSGDLTGALACYRDPENAGDDVALGRVGLVLRLQSDYDGALAAMRQGLAVLERRVEENPRDQAARFHLGTAHSTIASTLADRGDLDAALASYRTALELLSRTASRNPMDPHVQCEWGVMHLRIAYVLRRQGKTDGALQFVQRGRSILSRILEAHGDNPHYRRYAALFELEWGDLCQRNDSIGDAIAHWRAAGAILKQLVAADQANAEWQRDLAYALARVASATRARGDVDAALAILRGGYSGAWQDQLDQVRADIEQLADDLGTAPAPSTPETVASGWLARTLSRFHLRR